MEKGFSDQPTRSGLMPEAAAVVADATWTELRNNSDSNTDSGGGSADGKMGVAKLLNSIWPENGSVANRFMRLQKSSDKIFALMTRNPSRVLGSGSLRNIRESDGPELTAAARLSPSPCILFSLIVDTPLQGLGLGSDLLRQMETEAAARGHSHVFLSAEPHLARGFYEKRGYRQVSEATWKQRTRKPMDWLCKAVVHGETAGGVEGGMPDCDAGVAVQTAENRTDGVRAGPPELSS